jgi:UDP-N-acetylmuramate--alanine ligase
MNFGKIHSIYFLGIGGIGMSALAQYFIAEGKKVSGYDRSTSPITKKLSSIGADIHFSDDIHLIPKSIRTKEAIKNTLVIYTPAIPIDNTELEFFKKNRYLILKRAEVLGFITRQKRTVAIAGTHGKTSVTTMTSFLLRKNGIDCSAFMGGISKNFKSNIVFSNSNIAVVEADEYDRSFLQLKPYVSVITSIDADHLDIYEDKSELIKSFNQFANQTVSGGKLIIKKGLNINLLKSKQIDTYYYSITEKADFYADNIELTDGLFVFDLHTPFETIKNIRLGLPGRVNVENAVASCAAAIIMGIKPSVLKNALKAFKGVQRRFDYHLKTANKILIDDYAHHPEELKATITSIRELYPTRSITGIFQPHLYSRTRDFADEFASSLNLLDQVILLEIYPAREAPIAGVSSELIFKNIRVKNKFLCRKTELINKLENLKTDIVVTFGAGDIDTYLKQIKKTLRNEICGS